MAKNPPEYTIHELPEDPTRHYPRIWVSRAGNDVPVRTFSSRRKAQAWIKDQAVLARAFKR